MIPHRVARAIESSGLENPILAAIALVWTGLEVVWIYVGGQPSIESGAVNSGTLPGNPRAAQAHDIDRGLIGLVWICR